MKRIPLGSKAVDNLLGGGIESGSLTLLYGEAGTGKTNICLQTAYNVLKNGMKVALIDGEGVSYERVGQIFEEEDLLKNLLVFQVHSFEEQGDRVNKVARMAETRGELGLIIVDSLTVFYRLNHDDPLVRNDFIRQIELLTETARKANIPVLVTSQVYSNINLGSIEFLGGHVLRHNAKTIIRLELRGKGVRSAVIIKHRSLPEGRNATYRITETGITDI
ncbi:MAG TPA: DNA repair and recombination protein RadB [Candidatus Methanomethylophilaceae archaeon]|nr:DNA repair and recombination protein RadB [Candidatus Methanomethylophilaceae archaeon]